MAIARVSLGVLSVVATNTITPAFAQATTAGNFLVAYVMSNSTLNSTTSGWTQMTQHAGNNPVSDIFYKENCAAGESAPTFTTGTGANMTAYLEEYSGVATSASFDKTHATLGSLWTYPLTLNAPDSNSSDLLLTVNSFTTTKSCTVTFAETWGPAGGTALSGRDNGATKGTLFMRGAAYLLNGAGGGTADSVTVTPTLSTGVTNSGEGGNLGSFLPAPPPVPNPPQYPRYGQKQAVHRASRW